MALVNVLVSSFALWGLRLTKAQVDVRSASGFCDARGALRSPERARRDLPPAEVWISPS